MSINIGFKRLLSYLPLTGLLLATMAWANPAPNVTLTFEVNMGDLKIGKGIDKLQHDSSVYTLNSRIIPKGLASLFLSKIERESKGSIVLEGLRPDYFSETGNKKKGSREATFDWVNNQLTLVTKNGRETLPLTIFSADQATPTEVGRTGVRGVRRRARPAHACAANKQGQQHTRRCRLD